MLPRHLNYFIAVAEHGGFTRAAAILHVSQPVLSQQIRQLEETLGVRLFDRSGRNTCLTDAGKVWLIYARRALRELAEGQRALHDVEDLQRGTLRVAMMPTFTHYFMGPLVASFYQRYPNITLDIQELAQNRMETLLLNDELDIGIAFDGSDSRDIVSQPLLSETLALVVGRSHPLAATRRVALTALNQASLILLSSAFATREQIDRDCRQRGIQPKVQMEANSISAVLTVVERTSLATLLPAAIVQGRDDLTAIELAPSLLERTACLIQRKGAWQSAATREFILMAHQAASILSAGQGFNESTERDLTLR
ncbi:transcriptional regulator CynR [Klebsiella michiganensis]|uniref:LysR family transcriptional regulator n=1 Tax=Klebsiella michiganensis TaxID=1134687 RepID=A0ABR5G6M7_9ENTR|nr:transcriptional regulator CynR [Klebsiella michiganensis]AUW14295.1 transcriptional regulator CynR [Klebsiella oxytoca]EWF65071.1 LysR family transcriptional regulator [Klebsiella michiganensis]KLY25744.1 LysR family transcriptional regulator [Klebsiella michiganensis]OUG36760.1 DNA-binding transcriptional regulator CynR [Klebsiella michiganensis]HED1868198.1 transcriptional regulator CynR [Klebsiella michiganensis]